MQRRDLPFSKYSLLENQRFEFWGYLGATAPRGEKQRSEPICTIMQNFMPIGVTVSLSSRYLSDHTQKTDIQMTNRIAFACVSIVTVITADTKRHVVYRQCKLSHTRYLKHEAVSTPRQNKNLAIANRSRVSCAHNTLRPSIGHDFDI